MLGEMNMCEMRAVDDAAQAAGEFIDETGQFDITQWTPERWHLFIQTVCLNYVLSLINQRGEAIEAVNKIAEHVT